MGLSSKLVTVLSFNFVTLLNMERTVNSAAEGDYGTGYAHFYKAMTEVPFFGDYYNYILPSFILVIGIMTLFKFHKRVNNITKKIVNQNESASEIRSS